MLSQTAPIHRTYNDPMTNDKGKNDIQFDAFNFTPGQDRNIRWLSRPNQKLTQEKYPHDPEKFRITFDAENFQPEQIKIYIQNCKLTITGVYEERSDGRFTQKQFERSFDIPYNADIEAMAAYITPADMLVVEIPLDPNLQQQLMPKDYLSTNRNPNDQRRLSFSLNKFNTLNNPGSLLTLDQSSSLPTPGQQVRRTSVTKTTTTTTTGSTGVSPEATGLLRNRDTTVGDGHTYSTRRAEHHASNSDHQPIIIHTPSSSALATANNDPTPSSTITSSELTNLPIEIPPELLATGGTITIQKRKVSVTKTTDSNTSRPVPSAPLTTSSDTHSALRTVANTSLQSHLNSNQQLPVSSTSERCGSKTISASNQRCMFTLEEFLQNKTWNPSIVDGPNGKKILHMRLQLNPNTTDDQLKITSSGLDLRIEIEKKAPIETGQLMTEKNCRQITLFPTCDVHQLKTELKSDGFLDIQVPIKL